MLGNIVNTLWNIALQVLNIQLPIGEYEITFMELFIYGFVVTLMLKLLFGWGGDKQ